MADKILEETNKDVTEGTQTEGTSTGNGYLTKPYLVRNLQTFWGKIKEYITNQKFVNQDTVNGALLSKAEASALKDLETTVTDKVSQAELTERLAGKVDAEQGKGLSTNDFTDVFRDKLKNLPASVATYADMGFMSADDKKKLDGIDAGATAVEVDTEWNPNSTNPAQSKVISDFISGELAKKVDKENDPLDPSKLIELNNIIGYATDEGHIVLKFTRDTEHLKIYTPNSDRPIETVSLKNQDEILFTNFQKNDDNTLAITIENPEGKEGDQWKVNYGESFKFYVENFVLDNSKYKPFVLEVIRSNNADLTKISLNIIEVF